MVLQRPPLDIVRVASMAGVTIRDDLRTTSHVQDLSIRSEL